MAFRQVERCTFSNILPVFFVILVIGVMWLTYVVFHLMRLIQPFNNEVSQQLRRQGYHQLVTSQLLLALMLACFCRAIGTDPGSVPDTDDWLSIQDGNPREGSRRQSKISKGSTFGMPCYEVKQSGERRFCQKCNKYKPDRCHHCRVCNSCVLRMDHHCPWIANCVGWANHKYFFLLVMYAAANCMFMCVTLSGTLARMDQEEMTPNFRFCLVFGTTLAWIMGILLVGFFGFHCWLLNQAWTTIEFCEKRSIATGSSSVDYNHGLYENLRAVLGPNPLLWLLPVSPPIGDGLSYVAARHAGIATEDTATAAAARAKKRRSAARFESKEENKDESRPEVTEGARAAVA